MRPQPKDFLEKTAKPMPDFSEVKFTAGDEKPGEMPKDQQELTESVFLKPLRPLNEYMEFMRSALLVHY